MRAWTAWRRSSRGADVSPTTPRKRLEHAAARGAVSSLNWRGVVPGRGAGRALNPKRGQEKGPWPAAQREPVQALMLQFGLRERRACRLVGMSRSTCQYRSRRDLAVPLWGGCGCWPSSAGGSAIDD